MPLQITGRHMTVTDEQKQYIDKKVGRLRRLCPKIDELSFTLTKEKINYLADATLRAGSIAVQGSVSASQPLEAIDVLVDKIESQVTKTKGRRTDRSDAARGKAALHNAATAAEETEGEEAAQA